MRRWNRCLTQNKQTNRHIYRQQTNKSVEQSGHPVKDSQTSEHVVHSDTSLSLPAEKFHEMIGT